MPKGPRTHAKQQMPVHNMVLCDADMQAGTYTLSQVTPPGTTFSHWECYNVTNGTAGPPINGSSLTLPAGNAFTCVAVYTVSVAPTNNPRLALLSEYPASYPTTSETDSLTAVGPGGVNASCIKSPSPRLGIGSTLTSPGAGLCFGSGSVPPGTYSLSQVAAPGTLFQCWDCYNVTTGTAAPPVTVTNFNLAAGVSMTRVAVYIQAPTTPRLALLSNLPLQHSGQTGNLTATSAAETCQKAPSPRLNATANVAITFPFGGGCGIVATSGTSRAGNYTVDQVSCTQ
jgi:hypothetical protein